MKKALLMALCLLIAHSVFAYDYLYNGVYYNLDHVNQTATVTYGNTSYGSYGVTIYNSYSGTVNIPDYITTDKGMDYDVVAIGDNAFRGSTGLTSVTIATGIETIGNNAFYECSGLTSIKLPNSVTTLGSACFRGCSKMTEVTFSSRITAIPYECFSHCSALKNVTLPKDVTTIGNYAFRYCSALANVSFSTVLTSIGNYAFSGCYNLSSVTLPSSVQGLGSYAFSDCSKLSAINLNEGLVKMGDYALAGCSSLTEVSLPSTVETIGKMLFASDNQLANVTMNCKVTELPDCAFQGCSALSIVTLPSALTTISFSAFNGCSILPSLTIPATLSTVKSDSFKGCNNLKQLTFAEGMTTIPRTYAYAITQVSLPSTATIIADDAFNGCKNLISVSLSANMKAIGDNSFYGCTNLVSLTMNDQLSSIGAKAFYGCTALPSIALPASLTTISTDAFSNCSSLTTLEYAEGTTTALRTYATKLTKVTIPSTCHTLADNIFAGCTALSSVYISHLEMWNLLFLKRSTNPFPTDHYLYLKGQLLTDLIADFDAPVANFAFANTKGLKSVTLTGSITGVDNSAFLGCSSLESVRIGVAVKEIGNNAFYGCSSLKSVRMGGQEQSIGDGAFKECVSLPSLKLPTTVRTIGTGAFEECKALTQITLPDGMTAISDRTFYNCILLPEISIPSSVTTICSEAFYNCAAIELLDLPNSVEKIGKNAFSQCVNLNFATVGTGVKTIESGAFANCSMLKAFYCLATDVPNTNTNSFDGSMPESITLYVPDESVASYKSQSPWKSFATTLGTSAAPTYANNIVLSPEVLILDDDPDHEDYIRATVSPSDATNAKVTWTSSNTSVATVSRTGLVSPIMEGVATITATAADKHGARATALVIVANKFQSVTSLALDKTTLTLTEGEQLQLVPTTQPATASYDVITWTSSDDNIATVSEAGIITALNQGYADIIATTSDGTKLTAICKLTVDAPATPGLSTVSDANGDGVIDANDIIAVKKHILGRDTSFGNACDVNGDGNVTMADVATITAAMKGEGEIITGPLKFIGGLNDSYDIVVGESKTITPVIVPYRAGDHIDWSIDDDQIASITPTPDGSYIIKTIAAGRLTLTATANDGSGLKRTSVIYIHPNFYGNTDGHNWVDLGLPSGTLWATNNVGATTPEGNGGYYAWGETIEKTSYTWKTYSLCKGSSETLTKYCTNSYNGFCDYKKELEAQDDVATVTWSDSWCMPTNMQFEELFNNDYTTSVWTTQSGVYGHMITSKLNGCSIFLPAAGYKDGYDLISEGVNGYYASKNLHTSIWAYYVEFEASSIRPLSSDSRAYGFSIRPVTTSTSTSSTTIISKKLEVGQSLSLAQFLPEDINVSQVIWSSTSKNIATIDTNGLVTAIAQGHTVIYATDKSLKVTIFVLSTYLEHEGHEYVDLGLPSGTKWATCNVGAETPEDYGDYFAWGETTGYKSGKTDFSWSTYKWFANSGLYDMTKYITDDFYGTIDNKIVLDPEDDAAIANWGGSWRMPTKEEQDELRNNCTWTSVRKNGVKGISVTGPNGNSIFLPTAGSSGNSSGFYGYYWSSTLDSQYNTKSYILGIDDKGTDYSSTHDRSTGFSIRAVCP